MSFILDLFYTALKYCAGINPRIALGTLFGITLTAFFTGLILSIFNRKIRIYNKRFFLAFSKFIALALLVYCLAETYYISKTFTLTSSILTVGMFYMFTQLKVLLLPSGIKEKVKKDALIKSSLKKIKPFVENPFFLKPEIKDVFMQNSLDFEKNNAELNNILYKLKNSESENSENNDSKQLSLSDKDIKLSNIKKFTSKLYGKNLSCFDKDEVAKLDRMTDEYSEKKRLDFEDLENLNDSLSSLLKMMSKYSV